MSFKGNFIEFMRMVGNELAVQERTVTSRLAGWSSVSSMLRSKAELMTLCRSKFASDPGFYFKADYYPVAFIVR